jgi:Flp pilus assembly protein TadG
MLPVLILILIGILDLGRITATYVVLTNAAREGARYGASHPTDASGITARARAEVTGTLVAPAQISVTFSCNPSCVPGNPLQVQATYPFSFITTSLFAGLSTINISTNATFQIISN